MKIKAGYIGIKEASQLVGVHPDTIRRLIKQHKGSPNIVQGKGTKAPYYLNEDWLRSLYSLNEPFKAPIAADNQPDDKEPSTDTNKAMLAVVEALTAQLDAKDKQLATAQATIDKMASDYSTLLNQSQQLQGLLLPDKTPKAAATKNTAKQPQENRKVSNKKPAKKKQSEQIKNQAKKRWWKR